MVSSKGARFREGGATQHGPGHGCYVSRVTSCVTVQPEDTDQASGKRLPRKKMV
jgi:hypothetical protein